MHSLENKVLGNLRCHFGGLAITFTEPEPPAKGRPASPTNPKAAAYDVDAARKASYETATELVYNRYGAEPNSQPGARHQSTVKNKIQDDMTRARQQIFDTLKASPEIAAVSDLYPDGRFKGSAAFGAFSPIFFIYDSSSVGQLQQEPEEAPARRHYFIYNGRFLIAADLSQPNQETSGLPEAVSKVFLLLSKSGRGFRLLPPIPTLQSYDLGGVTSAASPVAAVLNESIGRAGMTTSLFLRTPRTVQDSLRSLYASSFQYLMAFYSMREECDTQEALFKTIEAQRGTVLNLVHELNQTKRRHLLKRRGLRRLIGAHCLSLTEKVGRVETISDSISQGISSLETSLQDVPSLKSVLEKEPNWKSYLSHEFDAKQILDLIGRTSELIGKPDLWFAAFWLVLVAAAAGALAGSLAGGII